MQRSRSKAAFTLLEILIVIVVIGLLGSLVVGGFTNVVPAGREAAAVNKARIVNAARLTFALTVPDAASQWTGAGSDSDRAALLVSAGALNGVAADWVSSAGGYTLGFGGSIRGKTVLRDRTGQVLTYSD